jgi:hypothetical protein
LDSLGYDSKILDFNVKIRGVQSSKPLNTVPNHIYLPISLGQGLVLCLLNCNPYPQNLKSLTTKSKDLEINWQTALSKLCGGYILPIGALELRTTVKNSRSKRKVFNVWLEMFIPTPNQPRQEILQ